MHVASRWAELWWTRDPVNNQLHMSNVRIDFRVFGVGRHLSPAYPGPPTLFHVRVNSLFVVLWLVDIVMFAVAVESTLTNGVGGMVLFASEVRRQLLFAVFHGHLCALLLTAGFLVRDPTRECIELNAALHPLPFRSPPGPHPWR